RPRGPACHGARGYRAARRTHRRRPCRRAGCGGLGLRRGACCGKTLAARPILSQARAARMPEESLETQELKEKLDEAGEAAERGEGKGPSWVLWLSLSTAVIAVLAAIGSLLSGSYANDSIVQKNDAILHQSKADDAWSYYQAKSIKAAVYSIQADAKWQAEAARERREAEETQKRAQ